ncbi:protein tyrosine phosphatase receptor type C-associated protein [Gracilinanus agilis]|uniref:protein tyrosine phosphatase receptor type C-associated protein n=1 Tax=Gracilinanus agilis TaxID=191870 RepID=UPI001CFC7A8F|nr:protein tyrosine phosphatase receptor type C-associated protein [Gracilinanus agilis]
MALSRFGGLMALASLPGVLGSEDRGSHSSVTVFLLVLLLLILLTGLALAWYHLSRESGGYYHPTRLGISLWSQARRLLRATGAARWLQGPAVEELQDSMEKQEEEEEEEDEEEQEQEEEPEGESEAQPSQKDKGDVDGASESPGEGQGGEAWPKQRKGSSPRPERSTSSGGSAEALLSDLHAFSGTAAWEDGAGTERGQGLSVTAL